MHHHSEYTPFAVRPPPPCQCTQTGSSQGIGYVRRSQVRSVVELKFQKAGIVFHQSLWRVNQPPSTSPAPAHTITSELGASASDQLAVIRAAMEPAEAARQARLNALADGGGGGGVDCLLAWGAVTVYSIDKATKRPCPVPPSIEAMLAKHLLGKPS